MSCYRPMLGVWTGEFTDNGKKKYRFIRHFEPDEQYLSPGSVVVPCGNCIGCRLDYSRSWADRMMLELETSKDAVFVTLTYDPAHVTLGYTDNENEHQWYSLNKVDVQDFHKRLRHYFEPRKIRFYLAGEYGEHTFRPHYHAIYFGLSLEDFPDRELIGRNELGQPYYKSNKLASIWKNGNALLCNVSWNTCAYVARYVTKKLNGKLKETYDSVGIIPEFSLMSRKPGLGAQYLADHPDCLDFETINLSTDEGGRKIRIPKYYLRQMELQSPEDYAIIKERRKSAASDAELQRVLSTDLSFVESLDVAENEKLLRNRFLRRTV